MLGTFKSVVLSERSPQCKTLSIYHIPVQWAPLQVVLVQETLDMSASVWQHVFLGTRLQSAAWPPIFAGSQWWFQHISTFGPKVPLAPKAPLARKLKYVEITIANLQKWEAKQLTGDVFPKKHVVRHLQTCPVFLAPRQPAKVLIVQVYDIWIVFCTGEIFLTGQLI